MREAEAAEPRKRCELRKRIETGERGGAVLTREVGGAKKTGEQGGVVQTGERGGVRETGEQGRGTGEVTLQEAQCLRTLLTP